MNNRIKSKTRLAFIQIIFQHISTKNDIIKIYDAFNLNYKSIIIEDFNSKKKIKFEFNSNFLKKLSVFYSNFIDSKKYLSLINKSIDFKRSFEKWDIINQSIILAILSEIEQSESSKVKIIFNDYLNISKYFIDKSEVGMINAIVDKIINVKK